MARPRQPPAFDRIHKHTEGHISLEGSNPSTLGAERGPGLVVSEVVSEIIVITDTRQRRACHDCYVTVDDVSPGSRTAPMAEPTSGRMKWYKSVLRVGTCFNTIQRQLWQHPSSAQGQPTSFTSPLDAQVYT